MITGGNSGIAIGNARSGSFDEGAQVLPVAGRRQEELDVAVKQLGEAAHGRAG